MTPESPQSFDPKAYLLNFFDEELKKIEAELEIETDDYKWGALMRSKRYLENERDYEVNGRY